jgi:hypothetical protein
VGFCAISEDAVLLRLEYDDGTVSEEVILEAGLGCFGGNGRGEELGGD